MHAAPEEPRKAGYPKSEATRRSILKAGIRAFAEQGYAAATTRRIAQDAGVALPAIAYHFAGKEGLYSACAEAIVQRHRNDLAEVLATAQTVLEAEPPAPDACRDALARILKSALRSFLNDEDGQARVDFAIRALRDEGEAVSILARELWEPGMDVVARLIAARRGSDLEQRDRTDALLLLSSLLALPLGPAVAMRLLGLKALNDHAFVHLDEAIERQIDRLAP